MSLYLGQLVYTRFPTDGYKVLTSAEVPPEVRLAFTQRATRYWDNYEPLEHGYRCGYVHQVAREATIFGWFYNDGADELGRSFIPYFICYYLPGRLQLAQLQNIFTLLHKGPLKLIDRQAPPEVLETLDPPDLWSYQAVRIGVTVPARTCEESYRALYRGEMIDLFIAGNEADKLLKSQQKQEVVAIVPTMKSRKPRKRRIDRVWQSIQLIIQDTQDWFRKLVRSWEM
jgi:hypothetical protein